MKALLDTHTLLWWLDGDKRLSPKAKDFIAVDENVVLVSAASTWEIATKVRIGKLPGVEEVSADLKIYIAQQGFSPLAITIAHAQRGGALPGPLRDPFDRILIAQAQEENVPLISNEAVFDDYGIRRLW